MLIYYGIYVIKGVLKIIAKSRGAFFLDKKYMQKPAEIQHTNCTKMYRKIPIKIVLKCLQKKSC